MEGSSTYTDALRLVMGELDAGLRQFPSWPTDPVHAAAIMNEEAGECVRAANQFTWDGVDIEKAIKEAAQTAAMAIRFIAGARIYTRQPSRQKELF